MQRDGPRQPAPEDTLAYVQPLLKAAEEDFRIVTHDLRIVKKEWKAALLRRAKLRQMERHAMIRLGLDIVDSCDWSFEPSPATSDPEGENKEADSPLGDDAEEKGPSSHDGDQVEEDAPPPRPSKAPRMTSASRSSTGTSRR